MALAAYLMGAKILEKHVTAHRSQRGADHAFSLEPVGAALFSAWYWKEPFGPWDVAGGALPPETALPGREPQVLPDP